MTKKMEWSGRWAQWNIEARLVAGTRMADLAISDQELFRQLAKGSEAAFSALYRRYQGALYRFALHMSGNGSIAEEVTQEVFMQVIVNPKSYDPGKGSLAGYLFGIARNLARRARNEGMRDIGIDDECVDEAELGCDGFDALEELSRSELIESLQKAILTLPPLYREVVVLCEMEEFSYPAAAEALRCSPGTVASRLHRARAMLKAKLKGQGCLQ